MDKESYEHYVDPVVDVILDVKIDTPSTVDPLPKAEEIASLWEHWLFVELELELEGAPICAFKNVELLLKSKPENCYGSAFKISFIT